MLPHYLWADGKLCQIRADMIARSGRADLPLHSGRVPPWLAERMAALGAIICQAIVHHYGRDEFLRRLSHPFWFQSFGAVMGMDWHSSGITTSVIGALKRGLAPIGNELGIHVCGGRGKHSRRTPEELTALGDRIGIGGVQIGADTLPECGAEARAGHKTLAPREGIQVERHKIKGFVDGHCSLQALADKVTA